MVIAECAVTQEDQDNADEKKKREAMRTLVQTWLDSLQLISVIVSKFIALFKLHKFMLNYLYHSSGDILYRD